MSGFIGGYIFGFSSYEIGQTWGHLMITFTCLVPLMVLLFLLKVHKKLNSISFIILLSLSLILQFFISQEVFTIFNLFGVFSIIISLFIFKEQRKEIFYAVKDVIFSYIVTVIIISPYLYYMLISIPKRAIHNPAYWSSDVLNFLIPTPITFIGGKTFSFITSKFYGTYAGEGAYLGLPLIFLLYLYFVNFYKTNKGKFLLIIFLMVSVFSLGPFFYIYGTNTKIIMPWIIFAIMPLLKDALPGRFALYVFLVVAVVAGYFIKEFQAKKWLKLTIIAASILFILPSLPYLTSSLATPPFFSKGLYKEYLKKDENVLIIPFSYKGYSDAYQAISRMYFKMAGGYLGLTPSRYNDVDFVQYMLENSQEYNTKITNSNQFIQYWMLNNNYNKYNKLTEYSLIAFIVSNRIKAVIVTMPKLIGHKNIFSTLKIAPVNVGGVILYKIPPSFFIKYRGFTNSRANASAELYVFSKLYFSSKLFLKKYALKNLYPEYLEKYNYLNKSYGFRTGSAINWTGNNSEGWIGSWSCRNQNYSCFGVGIMGNSDDIKPIIKKYKNFATQIFFPYPKVYNVSSSEGSGQLLMIFRLKSTH